MRSCARRVPARARQNSPVWRSDGTASPAPRPSGLSFCLIALIDGVNWYSVRDSAWKVWRQTIRRSGAARGCAGRARVIFNGVRRQQLLTVEHHGHAGRLRRELEGREVGVAPSATVRAPRASSGSRSTTARMSVSHGQVAVAADLDLRDAGIERRSTTGAPTCGSIPAILIVASAGSTMNLRVAVVAGAAGGPARGRHAGAAAVVRAAAADGRRARRPPGATMMPSAATMGALRVFSTIASPKPAPTRCASPARRVAGETGVDRGCR